MNAIYSHAWMQKHPTPTNKSGDFHWHPGNLPDAIRATLTELATRSRGRPASVWIIDAGYVAWARTFSAVAPGDGRRYTGLVATVGRPDGEARRPGERISSDTATPSGPSGSSVAAALPALLASMPVQSARPYAGQNPAAVAPLTGENEPLRPIDADGLLEMFDDRDPQVADAVYFGGQAYARAAHDDRLPAVFGALLSWIPASERGQPRTGMFTENRAAIDTSERDRAIKNLLHYLSGAWMCPRPIRERRPGFASTVWHLVCELAATSAQTLPELFEQLTEVTLSWDSAPQLLAHLLQKRVLSDADLERCTARAPSPLMSPSVKDAGWLWNRLLHYWGRGFLAGVKTERLTRLLALRIVADHLFYLDTPDDPALPERYLRRLRYEALLPRRSVEDLRAGLSRCIPSLSPNREDQLG